MLWHAPGSVQPAVVARAWTSGGLGGLRSVSGPWALAAWDPRSGEQLLVVDPVGVQPLFWTRNPHDDIVASSLLTTLLERAHRHTELDYEALLLDQGGSAFRNQAVLHRTPIKGVFRIPGGHALHIRRDGSTRLQRYWNPAELPGPDHSLTLRDCADLLRERIEIAVRRLVPDDQPIGAHVSGGLDCTSIACLAQRVLTESGRSLVAGYSWAPSPEVVPRFSGDERELLGDVADSAGFPVRTIGPDDSGEWFWQLDPIMFPNTDHQRECHVLGQARRDGVRVLLSGWGGDELASFSGHGVIQEHVRRGHIVRAWKEQKAALTVLTGQPPRLRSQARRFAASARSALPMRLGLRAARPQRNPGPASHDGGVESALRAFSPLAADLHGTSAQDYSSARGHRPMQLMLLQRGHLQRRIAGWHQTGHLMGLQYRYPLLDLGVVEAALRLPWWAFLSNGWSRPAFRLAVEPWVPASVAWNVAKYEPSLYWPPEGGIDTAALARRWRHLDDPQHEAVMELAMRTWVSQSNLHPPSHLRVASRQGLAPQV